MFLEMFPLIVDNLFYSGINMQAVASLENLGGALNTVCQFNHIQIMESYNEDSILMCKMKYNSSFLYIIAPTV